MGVHIHLDIKSSYIHSKDWEEVYKETLTLLKNYNFMDIDYINFKGHDVALFKRGEETQDKGGSKHWKVCGDLESYETAESFYLYSDIVNYDKVNSCGDILLDYCKDYCEHCSTVFSGKTQGYDYHIYVLAIACLIESRFPGYAIVHGNISKGEAEIAVNWANGILQKPLELPVIADRDRLLMRIKKLDLDNLTALEYFLKSAVCDVQGISHQWLQENFSEEAVREYYYGKFKGYTSFSQLGAAGVLIQYLNSGGDMEELCRIIAKLGGELTRESFVKALCNLNLFIEEEERRFYNLIRRDSRTPMTVEGQFANMFLDMNFKERDLDRYIPLEEAVEAIS